LQFLTLQPFLCLTCDFYHNLQKESQTIQVKLSSNGPPSQTASFHANVIACFKRKQDASTTVAIQREGVRYCLRINVVPKVRKQQQQQRELLRRSSVTPTIGLGLLGALEHERQHVVDKLSLYVPYMVRREMCSVASIAINKSVRSMESVVIPKAWYPRTSASLESFTAAAMTIDLSPAFAVLSEQLPNAQVTCTESIAQRLNVYFGSLMQIITQHGGDILKYTGTAFICSFGDPSKQDDQQHLALQAVRCALEIQASHRSTSQLNASEALSPRLPAMPLRICIGCGQLYALYIGGVGSAWELLLVGEPMMQLESLATKAINGDIMISSQCWRFMQDQCIAHARGADWIVTKLRTDSNVESLQCNEPAKGSVSAQAELALRCYVPKSIQLRIDTNQYEW
jgi:class 3 adenylate cyclase